MAARISRLRLLAQDADDLAVISAAMQDAVAKVGDISYEAKARLLTLAFNRYCWEAEGHVRVRSADPFTDPIIQPNYLAHATDRQALVGGLRVAQRLLRTPELARYMDRLEMPQQAELSDEEWLDYAAKWGSTCYHLIGTAKMGPATDPTAVVDDELRVHGLHGLRVVDASIMPSMVSANTYASTMMIAEKAADLIRGHARAEPLDG